MAARCSCGLKLYTENGYLQCSNHCNVGGWTGYEVLRNWV